MAWSVLQSAVGGAFASSVSATFTTANVQAGSKIIAVLASSFDATPGSVQDGAANNWTLLGSAGAAFSPFVWLYALDVPAGDVGTKPTITVTIAGPLDLTLLIQEVSGLLAGNTTAMLDGTPGTLSGSTAATGSPAYSSTAASEYLICAFGSDTGTNPAALGGWTLDSSSSSPDATVAVEYTNSTGGSETSGFTGAGTSSWGIVTAAFKLAASGTDSAAGYATAASDLGGGSGSWVNPGNADGSPDSSYAVWTSP